MATPNTCVPAEPSAVALLSAADASLLMANHWGRLARIAAAAESAVDAAIADHFAKRDRLEAAAHAALLARLAAQRLALRRLEAELVAPVGNAQSLAAALPAATPSALRKRADAKEPVMSATKTRVSSDGQPSAAKQAPPDAACATIAAPQERAAIAMIVDDDAAVGASGDALTRHRTAEAAYLARTAGRRTEHAAALSALAEVEVRIAALRASGPSARAVRRNDEGGAPAVARRRL